MFGSWEYCCDCLGLLCGCVVVLPGDYVDSGFVFVVDYG